MARIGDRPPAYVPAGPVRDHLMAYSKAALAELVYDFLIQDEPAAAEAGATLYLVERIRQRAEAVAHAVSAPTARRPPEDRP